MEYKRRIERRKEIRLRVPKFRSAELVFLLLPWSLYIGIGLDFSIAKTSQISFKIKIKINIQRIWRDINYLTNIVS